MVPLLLGVLLASVTLASCGRNGTPPSSAPTVTTGASVTTSSAPGTTTSSATTSTAPATPGLGSYQPMFPFATAADVETWRLGYEAGGHDPEIDTVTGLRTDSADRTATAAVVHLVRWGSAPDAPWEAVGTDDTTFSLTAPPYGASVASPLRAGGQISGVDENIRVEVRSSLSSAVVGAACCLPAGGDATPWSVTVSFAAPAGSLLVVAARTGGHVTAVERFAVTAVRAR